MKIKTNKRITVDGHDLGEMRQAVEHLHLLIKKIEHKHGFDKWIDREDDFDYIGPDFDTEIELTTEEFNDFMISYICMQEAIGVTLGQRVARTE